MLFEILSKSCKILHKNRLPAFLQLTLRLSEVQKELPEPDNKSQKAKIDVHRWKSDSRGTIKDPGLNFTLSDAKTQPQYIIQNTLFF